MSEGERGTSVIPVATPIRFILLVIASDKHSLIKLANHIAKGFALIALPESLIIHEASFTKWRKGVVAF
jgi:hypothetical protein